ncbi:hypothetical protein GGTG_05443 [Gaeumannomyces tritici R3-111a-1]|uniref:Uncharacterized protein n=1 Tax=Gaeumannomyces tritici (strain R3-111a-1) TaxID=644352 RepID=J3NVY1_GAET3|nr:hypothetical protein GGTG_05443 [Gaeumannomyces tritici R3-111a-1]EJT75510.1 hypothetical protein GGTG_05443 [Gaeumannomyces tritici R3-111a-1]
MAPALFARAGASQEDLCGPFGERLSDWVAVSLGILLFILAVVFWICRSVFVSSRDSERRVLEGRIDKQQEMLKKERGLLKTEREAAWRTNDWLRAELGEAQAKIGVLQNAVERLNRVQSPRRQQSSKRQGVQGLGISRDITSPSHPFQSFSEVSPNPDLESFSRRVLGHGRSADTRSSLRVDTAVASQKPVGSPVDTRGGPTHSTARGGFASATSPASNISPIPRRPLGNLADELADLTDDDDDDDEYFTVGSDGGEDDGHDGGQRGRRARQRSSFDPARSASSSPILSAMPPMTPALPPVSPVSPGTPVSPVSPGSTSISPISPLPLPGSAGRWAKQGGRAEGAASPADLSTCDGLGGAVIREARRVTCLSHADDDDHPPPPPPPPLHPPPEHAPSASRKAATHSAASPSAKYAASASTAAATDDGGLTPSPPATRC